MVLKSIDDTECLHLNGHCCTACSQLPAAPARWAPVLRNSVDALERIVVELSVGDPNRDLKVLAGYLCETIERIKRLIRRYEQ